MNLENSRRYENTVETKANTKTESLQDFSDTKKQQEDSLQRKLEKHSRNETINQMEVEIMEQTFETWIEKENLPIPKNFE